MKVLIVNSPLFRYAPKHYDEDSLPPIPAGVAHEEEVGLNSTGLREIHQVAVSVKGILSASQPGLKVGAQITEKSIQASSFEQVPHQGLEQAESVIPPQDEIHIMGEDRLKFTRLWILVNFQALQKVP